jgi:hypothetical protein
MGYATASGILGILALTATVFAWTLGSNCGAASLNWAIAVVLILYPVTLALAAITSLIGFYAQRKAVVVLGMLLALALVAAGVFASLPYHGWSLLMPCGIAI